MKSVRFVTIGILAAVAFGCSADKGEDIGASGAAVSTGAKVSHDDWGIPTIVDGGIVEGVRRQLRISIEMHNRWRVDPKSGAHFARQYWSHHVEAFENGKLAAHVTYSVDPYDRIGILRAYTTTEVATCIVDFGHLRSTGYGLVTARRESKGKVAFFHTAHWDGRSAIESGCDIAALSPRAVDTMAVWAPFFAANRLSLTTDGGIGVSPIFDTKPQQTFHDVGPASKPPGYVEPGVGNGMSAAEAGVWRGAGIVATGVFLGGAISCKGVAPCVAWAGAGAIASFFTALATGYNGLTTDAEKKAEEERKVKEGNGPHSSIDPGYGEQPGGYREPQLGDVGIDPGSVADPGYGKGVDPGGPMAGNVIDFGGDGDRHTDGGGPFQIPGCGGDQDDGHLGLARGCEGINP